MLPYSDFHLVYDFKDTCLTADIFLSSTNFNRTKHGDGLNGIHISRFPSLA